MLNTINRSVNFSNATWKSKNRSEDIKYRERLIHLRKLADSRRSVDEKFEQLKAVAESSTLIGGFTISAICEIKIPYGVDGAVLIAFGFTSSLVVSTCLYILN
jgi:hypothetical protein